MDSLQAFALSKIVTPSSRGVPETRRTLEGGISVNSELSSEVLGSLLEMSPIVHSPVFLLRLR